VQGISHEGRSARRKTFTFCLTKNTAARQGKGKIKISPAKRAVRATNLIDLFIQVRRGRKGHVGKTQKRPASGVEKHSGSVLYMKKHLVEPTSSGENSPRPTGAQPCSSKNEEKTRAKTSDVKARDRRGTTHSEPKEDMSAKEKRGDDKEKSGRVAGGLATCKTACLYHQDTPGLQA